MNTFKNSKAQGNMGMGAAIAYYTSLGWHVSIPLTDSEDYDFIADDETTLHKVQVKTTNYQNPDGRWCASLSTKGGNRTYQTIKKFSQSTGFLFIVTGDGRWYNIPCNIGLPTSSISLGEPYDKYLVNGTIKHEYIEVHRKLVAKEKVKAHVDRSKIEWPSKEEVQILVNELGYSATGRKLGVSDNAVRKHLK